MKKTSENFGEEYLFFKTALGWVGIVAAEKGLRALFLEGARDRVLEALLREHPSACPGEGFSLREGQRQVLEYLAGERRLFRIDIDCGPLSPFRRAVYGELLRIPYGETVSYGELAARLGRPGAARAVGQALAANPLPLVVPCHRVVGAGGALTGFSGGEGIATKMKLLDMEGARPRKWF
ncbi:MAG: methylated-DNA--[protein]-cysteine S-methyltransferase [Deltaproteobacteria bacterium]|nr:methylated-DNA--[protein]-cysteine S-methyltransferase [Deltaproteobacteria bacterium]